MAVAREARKRGLRGVVGGHIHHAEMRVIDGVLYCNDGDWVESLTALVEHLDGRLEIADGSAQRVRTAAPPPVPAGRERVDAGAPAGLLIGGPGRCCGPWQRAAASHWRSALRRITGRLRRTSRQASSRSRCCTGRVLVNTNTVVSAHTTSWASNSRMRLSRR